MSRDINKVILCGTLGRDPEFKDLDRTRLAKFSIATTDTYESAGEQKESTTWHDIAVWGKLTDVVSQLRKGNRVLIEGRFNVRVFKDTNGLQRKSYEVIAIGVTPLSSPQVAQSNLFGEQQSRSVSRGVRTSTTSASHSQVDLEPPPGISDDEIPF